ncbi:MAG: hypothetical protein V7739_17780 [Motiliproteus sp.]
MKNLETRYAKAKRLVKTGITAAGVTVLSSTPAWALSVAENTQISTGYTDTGTTVNLVISGILTVVLVVTGFGIIYALLRR